MDELNCKNCVWGKAIVQGDKQMIECHYYPAVVLPPVIATLDNIPVDAIEGIMDHMRALTAWPIVKPDDFCSKRASRRYSDNVPSPYDEIREFNPKRKDGRDV